MAACIIKLFKFVTLIFRFFFMQINHTKCPTNEENTKAHLITLWIKHRRCNCVCVVFLSMPVCWIRMESGTWHPMISCRGFWASTRSSTSTLKRCSCSPVWQILLKMGEMNILFFCILIIDGLILSLNLRSWNSPAFIRFCIIFFSMKMSVSEIN